MIKCPFCGGRHRTDESYDRCLDRHEASFDEVEALEVDHPLRRADNRVLIYRLMQGDPMDDELL